MKRGLALLVAAVLLAGPVAADQTSEHLYLNYKRMLRGWTVVPTQRRGDIELTQIVPPGQNEQNWTDEVAINILYGPPKTSAQELLAERVEQVARECEDTALGPINPSVENGYDTAMRAVACTKVKKWAQGEVSLYKVWRGRDAMYLVARSWRGPPFDKTHVPVPPETTLQWLALVQNMVLCDSGDPTRPCPNPNAPSQAPPPPQTPLKTPQPPTPPKTP